VSRRYLSLLTAVVQRWYRHDLGGAQHLSEALVLSKVEGAITPVIEMRDETGPPFVNPNSLRRNGGMRPGYAGVGLSKKLRASNAELRTNSKTSRENRSHPNACGYL